MPPAQAPRDNRLGILWMVGGMTVFLGNDAIVKSVSARVPTAQILLVRGLMAVTLVCLAAWRMGVLGRVRAVVRGWVAVRAACEAVGTLLYVGALFALPLANATSINLSAPLFIALLAYLMLGEQVGRVRWLAIVAGFVGVLLVIQPRPSEFNASAWLCLLATFVYSLRDIFTRRVAPGTPSILVTLATAATVTLIGAGVVGFTGWTPMDAGDVGLLAVASALLSMGYYAMIAAVMHGDLSVVAPFRYTGLLWALLLGYVVWGDAPNAIAWAGIGLLLVAGLFLLHEQRRPARG